MIKNIGNMQTVCSIPSCASDGGSRTCVVQHLSRTAFNTSTMSSTHVVGHTQLGRTALDSQLRRVSTNENMRGVLDHAPSAVEPWGTVSSLPQTHESQSSQNVTEESHPPQ